MRKALTSDCFRCAAWIGASAQAQEIVIAALGDSLTQGYGADAERTGSCRNCKAGCGRKVQTCG